MKTLVFQGDSITDSWRTGIDDGNNLGRGYPNFIAGQLMGDQPEKGWNIINRGISGNRIVDLYSRIKCDFINLKPDYLTILIGINDVWHEIGNRNGVDNDKFFRVYCNLIEEIRAMLPDIEIFILEPFVLKASATEKSWGVFRKETLMRAESARAVAEKYGLTFVPLQEKFDEAEKKACASYWLGDGVHPTAAGHEIIANEVVKALEKKF